MMTTHQSEGIVIQVVPFRDYDQIVTIFTPEHGTIKVIIKNRPSRQRKIKSTCTPLTGVDISWTEGKGELGRCEEIVTIRHYAALRTTLALMEAGCDLLRAIQRSQPVGKISPEIYLLLLYYMDKLPTIDNPDILLASFRLKILRYEGLIGFPFRCSLCHQETQEAFHQGGTLFCHDHCPPLAGRFLTNEVIQMESLTCCSSYALLTQINVSPPLAKGIAFFFDECLR
jgi:DNA repair protein RecO (recombination protein O)